MLFRDAAVVRTIVCITASSINLLLVAYESQGCRSQRLASPTSACAVHIASKPVRIICNQFDVVTDISE